MLMDFDRVPVIETGAAQRALVEAKAELADEVQRTSGGGAEPGDVAGVGRDFGFPQGDVEHRVPPVFF